MKYFFYTLLFILIFSTLGYGININFEEIIKNTKSENSKQAIHAFQDLALYYSVISIDFKKADSIAQLAIELSEKENNNQLCIESYFTYSKNCLPAHYKNAENYLDKSEDIANIMNSNDLLFQTKINQGLLQCKEGNPDKAINTVNTAISFTTKNRENELLFYQTLGDINNETSNIETTLENYFYALEISYEINNTTSIYNAYIKIIEFCLKNKLYAKSTEYIEKTKELFSKNNEFNDYDKLYVETLEQELEANTNSELLLQNGLELINKSKKNNFNNLTIISYSILRISFMKSNDLKSLCTLYCNKDGEEQLIDLKDEEPDLYYRILALIAENNSKIDSAKIYWDYSKSLLSENKSIAYQSNFYLRLGQFYSRQHENNNAVAAFKQSFDLALQSKFLPMAIDAASNLDSAYFNNGDIKNAYIALQNKNLYIDSNNKLLEQEKLNFLENKTFKKLEQITADQEKDKEESTNRMQLYIVGLIILVLLYSLVFLSKKTVSVARLKMFGYVTFIFIFEFLLFLLHNIFHSITHSTLLLMLMNVALVALILPIHHATEHRAIKYLIQKNRVEHKDFSISIFFSNLIDRYKKWLDVEHEEKEEK